MNFRIAAILLVLVALHSNQARADYILEIVNTAETLTSGGFSVLARHTGGASVEFNSVKFTLDASTSGNVGAHSGTGTAPEGVLLNPPFVFPAAFSGPSSDLEWTLAGVSRTLGDGTGGTVTEYTIAEFDFNISGNDFSNGQLEVGLSGIDVALNGLPVAQSPSGTVSATWGTAVPEPSSAMLLCACGVGLIGRRRRS